MKYDGTKRMVQREWEIEISRGAQNIYEMIYQKLNHNTLCTALKASKHDALMCIDSLDAAVNSHFPVINML